MDTKEENKTERGRGQRGGRGARGKRGDDDGKRFNRGENKGRKGKKPEDAPKDTYFYKFHFGPWPELEEMEVTIDTKLPEKYTKEERVKELTKDSYIKHLQHLDEEIKKHTAKIRELNDEKKIKRGLLVRKKPEGEGDGKVDDSQKSFQDLVAERNVHKKAKNALDDESNAIKKELDVLERELAFLMKDCDPGALSLHKVKKKISSMETKMETSSMSATQQAKMLKQIDTLEKSKKFVEKVQKMEPEKNKMKDKMYDLIKEAKVHRKKIFKINQILDEMNTEFKKRKEVSEENKGELDELEQQIQDLKKATKAIDIQKDEYREVYYKNRYECEVQYKRSKWLDFLYRKQNDLKRNEEERLRVEEEKKTERESMPNPYEDDIENIDFLIRLLNKNLRDHEQKQTSEIKNEERKQETDKLNEQYQKQAEEGKIQVVLPKHMREKEMGLQIGGRKGRKGGKKRKNQNKPDEAKTNEAKPDENSDKLSFKFEVLQNFTSYKVNIPESHADIPATVKALEEHRDELFTKGEQKLDTDFGGDDKEDKKDESEKTDTKIEYNAENEDDQKWPTLS